jgi:hypothetical protein
LEISRQFDAHYTAKFVPNTAHILQYTLCELWSRHIQCIYSSEYSGFNIQLNVSALVLEISRKFNARYTARLVPNTAHILQFTLCELWSRHIQCYYSSAYSGFNIHPSVSPMQLEICRKCESRYTPQLLPNAAHISGFVLCDLGVLSNRA